MYQSRNDIADDRPNPESHLALSGQGLHHVIYYNEQSYQTRNNAYFGSFQSGKTEKRYP